jgi:hypothetical protein
LRKGRAGDYPVPAGERAKRHGETGANQKIPRTEDGFHGSPNQRRSGVTTLFPLLFSAD